jgi:DNA-directed RNA polymerase subunit RPC12/RpoP
MKLSQLNPAIGKTAEKDVLEISFDCPKCGIPYRILAKGRVRQPKDESRHLWGFEIGFNWDIDCSYMIDWDSITVDPSIMNHHHGKKLCGLDVTISNGEIKV